MSRLLVLVPTDFELMMFKPLLEDCVMRADGVMVTCGFGPIAAGIRTAQLLVEHSPRFTVLVGIAGAIGPQLPIGTARCFSRFGCYGIGAGSGSHFQTAGELGWLQCREPQFRGPGADGNPGELIGDVMEAESDSGDNELSDAILLTVCAASASPDDVAQRLSKFPKAVAEDMEAYSVAMACRLARVPLMVIRGISNIAGDRDKRNWNVAAAINAAAELTAARIST